MRAGLFTDSVTDPIFRTGFVKSFQPDQGMYAVNLDGMSDCWAKPLLAGASKPYPTNTRVVCLLLPTSSWLILGEVLSAKIKKKTDVPQPPADAIYLKDLAFRKALQSRYDVTKASFVDPAQQDLLDGDAELSNRASPRSYLRIFENGDILSLASYYCFMLLSKAKNLFYTQARDALVSFAGYLFSAGLNEETKTATVQMSINSDPTDESDRDIEITAGAIPDDERPFKSQDGSKISEGLYTLFGGHTLLEVDNTIEEIRLSRVDIQAGKDVLGRPQQIRMSQKEISVEWDDQKGIEITASGIRCIWGDSEVKLVEDEATLHRGDTGVIVDSSNARMMWGAENGVVVNKNGVQVRGLLEIVDGRIKFSKSAAQGVQDGIDESVTFEETGGGLRATLNGRLTVLDINNDFTVRSQALLDQDFFTKYDTDMIAIQAHIHNITVPTPGAPVTPSGTTGSIGRSSAQRSALSSRRAG